MLIWYINGRSEGASGQNSHRAAGSELLFFILVVVLMGLLNLDVLFDLKVGFHTLRIRIKCIKYSKTSTKSRAEMNFIVESIIN